MTESMVVVSLALNSLVRRSDIFEDGSQQFADVPEQKEHSCGAGLLLQVTTIINSVNRQIRKLVCVSQVNSSEANTKEGYFACFPVIPNISYCLVCAVSKL